MQSELADSAKSKMTREDRLIQLYDQLRPALLAYLGVSDFRFRRPRTSSRKRFFVCSVRLTLKVSMRIPRPGCFE
jgi:hypothetical protein